MCKRKIWKGNNQSTHSTPPKNGFACEGKFKFFSLLGNPRLPRDTPGYYKVRPGMPRGHGAGHPRFLTAAHLAGRMFLIRKLSSFFVHKMTKHNPELKRDREPGTSTFRRVHVQGPHVLRCRPEVGARDDRINLTYWSGIEQIWKRPEHRRGSLSQ